MKLSDYAKLRELISSRNALAEIAQAAEPAIAAGIAYSDAKVTVARLGDQIRAFAREEVANVDKDIAALGVTVDVAADAQVFDEVEDDEDDESDDDEVSEAA